MKRSARDVRPFWGCGEWRYALLVLILLLLAGVTAYRVVLGLSQHPTLRDAPEAIPVISATVMALTGGFLFLAGAFGIWAIRITNEVEARRRVGRLVEDVDRLADGMVALDPDGRITGMNLAARVLGTSAHPSADRLRDWFPCLSADDEARLRAPSGPVELERVAQGPASLSTLRFRSQPSRGVTLLWISDVTSDRARSLMDQQRSHLQLIGRIARGVAHDFNNILCAISAHASLMNRPQRIPQVDHGSVQTILQESQRGAELARQLIQLSAVEPGAGPTQQVARHVENAIGLLRMMLPRDWRLCTEMGASFDAVAISGNQIEQTVISLGLLVSEACEQPGQLFVRLTRPEAKWIPEEEHRFEACIDVAASPGERPWIGLASEEAQTVEAAGLIENVVRGLVEEAGGRCEIFALRTGARRYRLWIPGVEEARASAAELSRVPAPMSAAARTWKVLMARASERADRPIEQRLRAMGIQVDRVFDLASALHSVEVACPYDAVLVDRSMLGGDAVELLRAMVKLRPSLGLVVTADAPGALGEQLGEEVVVESAAASPDALVSALWRAQELANRRRRAAA